MNNCNACYINVAEFKVFYKVDSFSGILKLFTDEDHFDELREFGNLCYREFIKEESTIIEGPTLSKVSQ